MPAYLYLGSGAFHDIRFLLASGIRSSAACRDRVKCGQLERQRARDIRPEVMLWMRERLDSEALYLDLYIGEQRFFALQPQAVELLSE